MQSHLLIPLTQISDIELLQESCELECKLAGGRDGNGAVPNDMWESYSAFANTRGGEILLGIKEKKGKFTLEGIKNPAPLIKNIWDTVNNTNKVSHNLLTEADVAIVTIADKQLIRIVVPRAPREIRPIYINGNPLAGSYVRRYEADQKCLPDAVSRMLAEREDVRDNRILSGYGLEDIDTESLRIYRQMFTDAKPQGHPFLEQDTTGFLRSIKAWRKDRKTQQEGLTLAGLVMFGTWDAIQDALPNYFVDYQEKDDSSHRWIDRVFPDGSWSGNIFDFYRKVYRKLTVDLKIGFQLKSGQRIDDTPAHEAIREALVNTLAHADYSSDSSLFIEKHPDFIGFRNPGLMRVPVKEAIAGGDSLCRNPAIHQMFLNIGLSEKAGSGIPKIYSNSRSQNWQTPNLYEKDSPEQTLLELRMVNLVSQEMHTKLIELFGANYNELSELKRSILITAATESWFNHERICALTSKHTRDITLALTQLVKSNYLASGGNHKGKVYHLKGVDVPTPDNDAGKGITFVASPSLSQLSLFGENKKTGTKSPELNVESPEFSTKSPDLNVESPELSPESPDLDAEKLLWQELLEIASPIRNGSYRAKRNDIEKVIIQLCEKADHKYLGLADIAKLLDRNTDTLRKNYLSPMLKNQQLTLAYPTTPNHPNQGYKIKKGSS
ncbi:MAG: putative DNA binding domain-containing protein [Colwellia sp.]|nr:putative DNA binding domain-containing protein [Colwellia sp.]